uniref:Uncharacterized protein n=1 Tax=Timema genevievae TaxID=629358 RepID=A0A7R9K3S9_TIMGE|nr:unnamed protein product [Timema genevievae]
MSTPDRDSNLILPVIGSPVYCESSALDHAATEASGAIKCFECNSHNDSRCSLDVLPVELKKDCSEHKEGTKYTMCRKIVQHIDFEVNGNWFFRAEHLRQSGRSRDELNFNGTARTD